MRCRTTLALAAASCIALPLACAVIASRPDNIKFSHKLHAEQDVACNDCHGDMARVASAGSSRLPKEDTCLQCHEEEKKSGKCGMCHTNADKPAGHRRERTETVTFSHETHVDRQKGDCKICHAEIHEATSVARSERPKMFVKCMECHRRDFRAEDCRKCHSDLVDPKDRPLSFFNHEGGFLERHKLLAAGDMAVCRHCHRESFCGDCHNRLQPMTFEARNPEKMEREGYHRHDFVSRHEIEARYDSNKCLSCHRTRDCQDCHDREMVSYKTAKKAIHEPGWMDGEKHGEAARRDPATCASCHDQGALTNCVACHRVGGPGGRPHGDLDERDISQRPCIYCH
jgi:ribosomal protein L40E